MQRLTILLVFGFLTGCISTQVVVNGDKEGTSYIVSNGSVFYCQSVNDTSITCQKVAE